MLQFNDLQSILKNIDVYLLDQILQGRIDLGHKILDAGCGQGRNSFYLVKAGHQVYGFDKSRDAISMLHHELSMINQAYPKGRFVVANAEMLPYKDASFDVAISSAVLHFAEDEDHFLAMVAELARVLKPGSLLFLRMTTMEGLKDLPKATSGGKYLLNDGSLRFLLTRTLLEKFTKKYGFDLAEPFKTVVVDDMRSMSVLLLRRTFS